jgi:broad specificity phosphatase PhoE
MGQIYLVRHAQASFGSQDYDQLSPLGEQQARWLGAYFAERAIRFERVVCGTQRRHRQSAERILEGMASDQLLEFDAGLNEFDFAALHQAAGGEQVVADADLAQQRRAFFGRLKSALQLWTQDQLPGQVPESWAQFQQRVRGALQALQATMQGPLLIVSSGGPMGTLVQQILGAPDPAAIELNLQIHNTGFCQLYFNAQTLRLGSFNAIPHLDRPDRIHAITSA